MEYDDNDFQGQNLNLAGEGSLKFSPVLRPYAIPKFDFDDSLQGHLRFDSLVENEVFLGIPSQEDNQWIEDFSQVNSGIDFDSGPTESCSISRHNNVWLEATSSESVEMLLKSVGMEERVIGETTIEEADVGDDLGNLTNPMESSFKQDEGKNHAEQSASAPDVHTSVVSVDPNLNSEEVERSSNELGSKSVTENFEEKNEVNGDNVNQGVIDNVVNETVTNEMPDPSVSKSECGNVGTSENLNDPDNQQHVSEIGVGNANCLPEGVWRSVEKQDMDTRPHMGGQISSASTVEIFTPSVESSLSVVSKLDFVDNQSTDISISDVEVPTSSHLKEGCEPHVTGGYSLDVSLNEPSLISNVSEIKQQVAADNTPLESTVVIPGDGDSGMHATEVDDTTTEISNYQELEVNPLVEVTHVQSYSVVEKENAAGIDGEEDTGALVSSSATCMLSVSGDKWVDPGDASSTGLVSDSTILMTACSSDNVLAGKTVTENLKVESNAHKVVKKESDAKDHLLPHIPFDSVQIHQENPSFELDGLNMDKNVSVYESGSETLSREPGDMEREVVGVLDSPKKPVLMSSDESCGNVVVSQGSDSHAPTETEPATKETEFESHETLDAHQVPSGNNSTTDIDIGHDDQPKSPIFGVSHQLLDYKKGKDVDVPREASPLYETSQASTVPESVSEGPTFEVIEGTSADCAGKVHEMDDQCASVVRVSQIEQAAVAMEVVQGGSNEVESSSTPCGSSIKEGAETEKIKETKTDINDRVQHLPGFPDNSSNDHQASADSTLPSKRDAHVVQKEGNSAILDKHGCDSPTVISCVELSHNAKDNREQDKDTIQENISHSDVTDNVEGKIQSVSHNLCEDGSAKEEMSFSFEVSPSVSLGDATKVWQSFPTIQASNLPMIAEGSASISVAPQVDPKITQEVTQCSPQTPVGGITKGGAKGTTERKARRKSGGKESAKKGMNVKETSAKQMERSEKLSVSLATTGTGQVLQFEELKSLESVELDAKKPSGVISIHASSVPDLNTSVSFFQQPFTDMQQVQLRAQILVYGSLIQGTTPEEACMIAAFGPSDGGRGPWEPAWRASIERLHGQKSLASRSDTPVQSRSGNTTPDQAVKHGTVKNKGPSSTTGRAKKKGPGTPSPVLSPMIPLSSPLWNVSTPSAEGLQANSMARGAHLDYHQSLSPLHPYQTPPMQNFVGHNPSWLSHGPFPGQWVAAPPTSPFNVSGRMSTLPLTEAVKLTPVKESGAPDVKRSPIPVVYSGGSSVFTGASPLPDLKIPTVSSVLPIGDSKSRKRKKVPTSEAVGQIALPGQTPTKLVSAPVFIGDLSNKAESHGQISLLAQSWTESVSVPVVSSIFSTAVTVSTAASDNSKRTPENFPSTLTPTPSYDQPKSRDQNTEDKVIVPPIGDSKSRKRKKVPTTEPVVQIALPGQTQTQLVSAPVIIGDLSKKAESHGQISSLAQNQAELVSFPVVSSIFSSPVAVPTTANFNLKSTPEKFPLTVTPIPSNDQPKRVDQNAEEKVIVLPIGDSKSRKRKKVPSTELVGQVALPGQTQTKLVSTPIVIGDSSKKVESHGQISLLAQSRTESVLVPVVSGIFSEAVAVSTTASFNSKRTPEKFPFSLTPTPSNDQSKSGNQNAEGKVIVSEEAFNKVEESKRLAEEASKDASSAISHCQDIWTQLEKQKKSGLVSDVESRLSAAAVSIAAAASVAKAAAAAAKIASNAAEQARLMAYEVLASSGPGDFSDSHVMSLPTDVRNNYGNATPASILKGGDGGSHSSAILVAAREASRRRVEAASAASRHAENIDAVVKAAELAAEAVSQAGKIVAMGEPLTLNELVASGPEGYWKTPQVTSEQQGVVTGNVTSHKSSTINHEGNLNVLARPGPSDMQIETLRHGEVSGVSIKDPMRVAAASLVSKTSHDMDLGGIRTHIASDRSKTIGVVPESEFESSNASVSVQNEYKNTSGILEENIIKEGCLVEVFKDGGKFKGAWFAANVLNLRDGKAYLCYTELESDEGKLKEWVALEGDGTKVPRIRIAHPMTSMKFEGTRKRRRGAVTDYSWNVGDRVDVWLHNCWCEGLVREKDKNDETSLSVHFPAQGETTVVRAWHLRPTLIWKDEKWIEWSSSKGNYSSQGDTPKEKRMKLGYPSPELRGKQKVPMGSIPEEKRPNVEGEGNDRSQISVDHVASGKHEEARLLPLSAPEKVFNIGKTTKIEKKPESHRTVRSGLQKEGPRVIFGVPKPGKKQKFMDVSKHYNGDRGNKNESANDPSKFTRFLMPQGTGPRGWTNNFKNDNKEKQIVERKPRVFKTGKAAQNPSGRTLPPNANILASAKFTSKGTTVTDNVVKNSASNDQNESGEQKLVDFKSSSNTDEISEGPMSVSSDAPPADAPKRVLTSKARSERANRGRLAPVGGKSVKQDVNDKPGPEVAEPRRSNRRIQPTSRLLEGLQSSLTISKLPAVSHDRSHRGQNKATPKGK